MLHLAQNRLGELEARGIEEAAPEVHVENRHGALRLYEKLGFVVRSQSAVYEKAMRSSSSP